MADLSKIEDPRAAFHRTGLAPRRHRHQGVDEHAEARFSGRARRERPPRTTLTSSSIGPGVISVAQTQVPSAKFYPLVVNSPATIAGSYRNTATVDWAPIGSGFTGDVVFLGRSCPGDTYLGNPSGKVALITRGACAVSLKVDRAALRGCDRAATNYRPEPDEVRRCSVDISDRCEEEGPEAFSGANCQNDEGLLTYIKAHGGQRIERIAAGMKTSSKDLMLPSKKLLADKKIKTKGEKRGTRYFPA